jgi:membrane-associated phospholipid phosphatase
MDMLSPFDYQTTVLLQRYIPPYLDPTLSLFSLLGSFEISTTILGTVLLVRKKLDGMMIFGLYGAGLVIELMGKHFLIHPGPTEKFFRYSFDFLFPTSTYQTGNSFPSGHALRASFIITLLLLLTRRSKSLSDQRKLLFTILLLGILGIMLISRISLGEHWPSDVLAGAALGTGLTLQSLRRSEKQQ